MFYKSVTYKVVQKKIARSLMHRHFATVCSRIMQFSPKCSEMPKFVSIG